MTQLVEEWGHAYRTSSGMKCCKNSSVCYTMSIVSIANTYYMLDALCFVLLNCFDMFLLNKIGLNQKNKRSLCMPSSIGGGVAYVTVFL